MIARRAERYLLALKEDGDLNGLRDAAIWNYEIGKVRTLKDFEDKLTPEQLVALSKAGCAPWQGAAFNKGLELIVDESVVNILKNSSTIKDASDQLVRLSLSKSLSAISSDLRASSKK